MGSVLMGKSSQDISTQPRQLERPLDGRRILIPPARPEANPLLHMLEKKGADVLGFPDLRVAPPADYGPMDAAIRRLKNFDWIVFSGRNCVENFFERLSALGFGPAVVSDSRIAAIGYGAYSALKKLEVKVDYVPKIHTAEGVVEGFVKASGSFLLVRVEGASQNLPERLKSLGAEVTEVEGYRMIVEASLETAEKAFGRKPDALALANPTAVRFLLKATRFIGFDLHTHLKGVTIAAVGPATAEAARSLGRRPDVVSKGHIADLVQTLTDLLCR